MFKIITKMIWGMSMLSLLSIIPVLVKSQSTATCKTPKNEDGICIPLESCNCLKQLVSQASVFQEQRNFLLMSRCDFSQESYVCCPDAENLSFMSRNAGEEASENVFLEPTTSSTTSRSATTTNRFITTTRRPATTTRRSATTTTRPATTTRRPATTIRRPATTTRKPVTTTSQRVSGALISATTMSTGSTPIERVSARKCNEYKEFAYNKTYVWNTLHGPPLEVKISNCAYNIVSLIVNGTEATVREFPHMALIGFKVNGRQSWLCGGSLISERFVLSAAHCSSTWQYGDARYVRLGEHDLNRTDDATSIDFHIIERHVHPAYLQSRPYNDIALFKLDRVVQFDHAIRPACLPEQLAVPTEIATASGWGKISYRGTSSNVLLKADLTIFSQNYCNSTTGASVNIRYTNLYKGIVEETQVCAGSHTEAIDTCQGDSGGPLQIYHQSHECTYVVVGLTSLGIRCAIPGTPGVYTRVFPYLSWIEGIVWPNK